MTLGAVMFAMLEMLASASLSVLNGSNLLSNSLDVPEMFQP
jgi:hypothetical protein